MLLSPSISIIIVGMNHLPYLKTLLHSLYNVHKPKTSFETIYVDNCSKDNSVSFIEENYKDVTIYKNTVPKGFGENNNYGVSKANGKYIALINPDIIILESSIDLLYKKLSKNPHFGIIVPQLLNKDLSIQHSIRSFISLKILFWRILSKGNDSSENIHIQNYLQKNVDTKKTQPIDWAIGAAMFMEKEFYNKLNGFDEDYYLYMEDEDLCLRSWKEGRPLVYYPEAKLVHNHIRGSQKIGKKTWLHIKSMVTFFRKHGLSVKRPTCNMEI